jgi:hypothetical protein
MSVTTPPPVMPYQPSAARGFDRWTPPPEVTGHTGTPIPPETWFFCPPPAEIGQVSSAWSNMTWGKPPPPRWLYFGIPIALALAAVFTLILINGPRLAEPVAIGCGLGVFALILLLCYFINWFTPTCTYVGSEGAARFKIKMRGNKPTSAPVLDTLMFPAATEVRTRQVHKFVNGAYTGTSYTYVWSDGYGRRVYKLTGTHRGHTNFPKPKDPYCYAHAAEVAFSVYLLQHAQTALDQYGFLHFNISGADYVRVGPGFIETHMRGETMRVTADEIKSLQLNQGAFRIVHKDAKWYSRAGKFTFQYGSIANAKLFLLALEKLVGYRFN